MSRRRLFGPRTRDALRGWTRLLVFATIPFFAAHAQEGTSIADPAADADEATAERTDPWTDELDAILSGVADHPALVAGRASVAAARRELEAVRFPVSVEASVSGTRVDATMPPTPPLPGYEDLVTDPSGWSSQASVSARLRPFVAGDLADLEDGRRIALERAERTLRGTRADLEAAAVRAAAAVTLARRAEGVAVNALAFARRSAHATELRVARGGATPREHERAVLDVARAEERVLASRAVLAEARANLVALTRTEVALTRIPLPPPAEGEPPAVAEARADLALAGVGLRSADRALLPTAHAAYAWNADGGSVSLSIQTRTFEPTLTYETPGAFGREAAPAWVPPELQPTVDGSFTVGMQMSFSAETHYARDAAEARRTAAAAGVDAALAEAAVSALSREEAVRAARMALSFAEQEAALVRAETNDARRREELGLEVPLAVEAEELALEQSDLAVLNARVDLLVALLRGYRELAVPLSEARP